MELRKVVYEEAMKIVLRVADVLALARRFEESPLKAMQEVMVHTRTFFVETLERVMNAEMEIFLGDGDGSNKRNGFVSRTYGVKGIGTVKLRVPRDREGKFSTNVIRAKRRYDEATERDLALLNLAGLSTRTLSQLSRKVLGIQVSAQEVSESLHQVVPAAKDFLSRPLGARRWVYLYVDGTNFRVRRSTVENEPTLVVLGVDETGRKSVLSMVQGDKDSRTAWEAVFVDLKERGLDSNAVQAGIMDGLPGLARAFVEAFPNAKALRCWVHKSRNVFPLVPNRYQAAFKVSWDAIAYAESRDAASSAFERLKREWSANAGDAVERLAKDIDALLAHYNFPKEHWDALRTTNPIERVNKEFKRRSKAAEIVSAQGLKVFLAFTALRLEHGWQQTPITSPKLRTLNNQTSGTKPIERAAKSLLN